MLTAHQDFSASASIDQLEEMHTTLKIMFITEVIWRHLDTENDKTV